MKNSKKLTIAIAFDKNENLNSLVAKLSLDERFKLVYIADTVDEMLNYLKDHAIDHLIVSIFTPTFEGLKLITQIRTNTATIISPRFITVINGFNSLYVGSRLDILQVSNVLSLPISCDDIIKSIIDIHNADTTGSDRELGQLQLEIEISELLREMGIPAHLKGYRYLIESIKIAYLSPDNMLQVTKHVYPKVAAMYNSNNSRIERSMRHAVEAAWKRPLNPVLCDIFSYAVDSKEHRPTNSEVIAMVSDYLALRHKKQYRHKIGM